MVMKRIGELKNKDDKAQLMLAENSYLKIKLRIKPIHLVLSDSCLEYRISEEFKHKIEILELLFKAGASINSTDSDGFTILHQAAFDCDNEMIKFISEKPDTNILALNSKFETAAAICQSKNNKEGLEILQKFDNS